MATSHRSRLHRAVCTTGRSAIPALLAFALWPGSITPAAAWPVSASAGYDFYTDYQHETTQAVVGTAGAGFLLGDLFATGMYYDNDDVGAGSGLGLGLGVPLAPMTRLRVAGTRFVGEESYRAWRFKAGPLFKLPTGQSLGIYWTHDQDNLSPHTNGVVAEAGIPLIGGIAARATAGYALSDGEHSARGSLGASGSVFHFFELTGEVGFNQNIEVGSSSPVPLTREGVRRLSILGGGSSETEVDPSSAVTTLLGVRVKFP